MAPHLSAFSPAQLKNLKRGPNITIRYRPYGDEETIILAESFPMEVAVLFSGLCRKTFPSVKNTPVADLFKPKQRAVIIEGGRVQDHKEIIQWMLSCCDGAGFRPLNSPTTMTFWYNANMLVSAQAFDIEVLEQELSKRVSHIIKAQVHSNDMRLVYTNLPRGHPIRTLASDSFGAALSEKRLLAYPAYAALKKDFPEFNEDLTTYMTFQKTKRVEAQKAERAQRRREEKAAKQAARKIREQVWREEQAEKKRVAGEIGQYYWKGDIHATVPLLDLVAGGSRGRKG